MKHLRFYLLFLCSLLCTNHAYSQFFRQLGLNDGLSNLSVLSISQDKLGRMWFGTNQGINIYDGSTIHNSSYYKNIYKNWELLEGRITDIVSDKWGNVFYRNSGNLMKYNVEKDEFTQIPLSHLIRTLCILNDTLHFTVADSLFMYDTFQDSVCFKEKLQSSFVLSLAQNGKKLYYGTKQGLYVKEGQDTKRFLDNISVNNLFVSSLGELWIGTVNDGLYRLNTQGNLTKETLSETRVISEQIRQITEDAHHNIWFGTYKGLQVYNSETDTYKTYTSQPLSGSISHNSIFSVYFDDAQGLWIGSYYGGVNYLDYYTNLFSYYPYSDYPFHQSLNHKIVGSLVENNDHNLWIATEGGGINRYNRTTRQYTYLTAEQPNSILSNTIKSMAYDKERDCLYIGTHLGGLSRYDVKHNKIYNYLTDAKHKTGPNSVIYKCIFSNNYLYVTAKNGFWKLDPRTDEFELVGKNSIYQEFEISDGYAWISVGYTMYRINLSDYTEVIPVIRETELRHKGFINQIKRSHDGLIYVATSGSGLYVFNQHMHLLHNYTVDNSNLLSNQCFNLIETHDKNILINGNRGLSLLMPESGQFYNIELHNKEKNEFAQSVEGDMLIASDSTIFISGIHGMISFKESDIMKQVEMKQKLHFSKILINNHLVHPSDENRILCKAVPFTSSIDLAYDQNNITVYFSNPFYSTMNNQSYYYKLEGFDTEWIPTDQHKITYTDLSAGTYTLKLCIHSLKSEINENEITLKLVIHRPWFLAWWAIVFYVLIISYVVYRFWKISLSRKLLALSLQKEKEEKERTEDLNRMKLNFFTNISHDFRTPLTLIIGQIEIMLQHDNISSYCKKKLLNIHRNASHMRLLITELLYFRKQEQGFLTLRVERVNAVNLVKSVYVNFAEMAQKRKIHYSFLNVEDTIDLWVDPVQMQKVIYNLISNAFKYTQNGHDITIAVNKCSSAVEIVVEDTGCGIPNDVIPHIFEHFYQVEDNSKKEILGTGIGLALVKGIVESHHGSVMVDSTEGKGSKFTVVLKKGNVHFTNDELKHDSYWGSSDIQDLSDSLKSELMYNPPINENINTDVEISQNDIEEQVDADLPKLLVVEDDIDTMRMLEEIFSPSYRVYTAMDGQMGFDKAMEIHPDLIVSDVMMPVLSGKDMCYRIKNCLDLAFVPVVLLTAQSSEDNIIKGYIFGADEYITKPFNVTLLLIKCKKLIENRQNLINAVRENKVTSLARLSSTSNGTLYSNTDQDFLDRTIKVIKANFTNPNFTMNVLASELNMARSRMYACVKEATGLTPNELVLKLKFEEALRMLKEEPSYNISEIAYQLGYNSPHYFTRSFKAFYGITPTAYKMNINS